MDPDETVTEGKWNEGRERRWEKEFRSMIKQTREILFSTLSF